MDNCFYNPNNPRNKLSRRMLEAMCPVKQSSPLHSSPESKASHRRTEKVEIVLGVHNSSSLRPSKFEMYVDSYITVHCVHNKQMFVPGTLHSISPQTIKLINNEVVEATSCGEVLLEFENSILRLRDVVYVPALNSNLLSISRLADRGIETHVKHDCMILTSEKTNGITGICTRGTKSGTYTAPLANNVKSEMRCDPLTFREKYEISALRQRTKRMQQNDLYSKHYGRLEEIKTTDGNIVGNDRNNNTCTDKRINSQNTYEKLLSVSPNHQQNADDACLPYKMFSGNNVKSSEIIKTQSTKVVAEFKTTGRNFRGSRNKWPRNLIAETALERGKQIKSLPCATTLNQNREETPINRRDPNVSSAQKVLKNRNGSINNGNNKIQVSKNIDPPNYKEKCNRYCDDKKDLQKRYNWVEHEFNVSHRAINPFREHVQHDDTNGISDENTDCKYMEHRNLGNVSHSWYSNLEETGKYCSANDASLQSPKRSLNKLSNICGQDNFKSIAAGCLENVQIWPFILNLIMFVLLLAVVYSIYTCPKFASEIFYNAGYCTTILFTYKTFTMYFNNLLIATPKKSRYKEEYLGQSE